MTGEYDAWVADYIATINAFCRVKERRVRQPAPTYLYAFLCRATGLVKIGYSHTPWRRLSAVQTRAGNPVVPVLLLAGCRAEEQRIHELLAEHRAHGEWFRYNARSVRDWIMAEHYKLRTHGIEGMYI